MHNILLLRKALCSLQSLGPPDLSCLVLATALQNPQVCVVTYCTNYIPDQISGLQNTCDLYANGHWKRRFSFCLHCTAWYDCNTSFLICCHYVLLWLSMGGLQWIFVCFCSHLAWWSSQVSWQGWAYLIFSIAPTLLWLQERAIAKDCCQPSAWWPTWFYHFMRTSCWTWWIGNLLLYVQQHISAEKSQYAGAIWSTYPTMECLKYVCASVPTIFSDTCNHIFPWRHRARKMQSMMPIFNDL